MTESIDQKVARLTPLIEDYAYACVQLKMLPRDSGHLEQVVERRREAYKAALRTALGAAQAEPDLRAILKDVVSVAIAQLYEQHTADSRRYCRRDCEPAQRDDDPGRRAEDEHRRCYRRRQCCRSVARRRCSSLRLSRPSPSAQTAGGRVSSTRCAHCSACCALPC